MKKKALFYILMAVLPVAACTSDRKKPKLAVDTLNIAIDPTTDQFVDVDDHVSLKVIGTVNGKEAADLVPTWTVEDNLGTFSPQKGLSTVFTGTQPGEGKIYAICDTVKASIKVSVGAFLVYGNTFNSAIANVPGADSGPDSGSSISLSEETEASGNKTFRADYTVTSNGWAGWFISSLSPFDMHSCRFNGKLVFDLKTDRELQVGVRSVNIDPGANKAKVFVTSEYGAVIGDGRFHTVSIPLRNLENEQAPFGEILDFGRISDLFIIFAVGDRGGAGSGSFSVDNVRWTRY